MDSGLRIRPEDGLLDTISELIRKRDLTLDLIASMIAEDATLADVGLLLELSLR